MSRKLWMLVLLACLLLPAAVARADDEFLPGPPPGGATWTTPPLYDRYPVWHYVNGSELQGPDTVYRLFYTMNLVQVGKAWLVKLALRSAEYAIRFDAVGPLVSKAGSYMRTLVASLWYYDAGALVVAGLLAAAAFAMWYGGAGARRGIGLRILGGAAVLLVGSYVLFDVAPSSLVSGASVARGLGGQVLTGLAAVAAPAGQGAPTDRLVRGAGETAWRALVLDPWADAEFGEGSADKPAYKDGDVPGGKWLAQSPSVRMNRFLFMDATSRYQDFYQWDENYMLDYLPRRFTLAGASALIGAVFSVALLVMAGGVIYYQLLLLGILALSPLWLLVALWHPRGLSLARGALVRALGALVAQVVLMAVLGVLLALVPAVSSMAAGLGWMAQALLLALLAAVLCRYRFRWLRWGREQGHEEVPAWRMLVERVRPSRASGAASRAVVAVASGGGGAAAYPLMPLPQFREEPVPVRLEQQPAQLESSVGLELVEEMRRLRNRLTREDVAAQAQVLEAAGGVRFERGGAGGGGAQVEPPQAAPERARPRPGPAADLHLYRKR